MTRVLRLIGVVASVAFASLGLVACTALGALNTLVDAGSHQQTTAAYGAGERRQLDVYTPLATPARARPPDGWPMVVFFYGGSWNYGERKDYRFVGEALAARGILTVIPDYRLYPEVRYPEFLKDNAAAVAWAMREAKGLGADAKRVFVMGHSAGGYNAAMMALDARWLTAESANPMQLAGWIGLAGPYDFLPIDNPEVKPVFFYPASPPESQPMVYVSAKAPRTFLGAALDDELVNPERNTQQLATKLQAAGVSVTLQIYPRTNHVTLIGAFAAPLRFLGPVLDDVVQFVKSTLPQ